MVYHNDHLSYHPKQTKLHSKMNPPNQHENSAPENHQIAEGENLTQKLEDHTQTCSCYHEGDKDTLS